MPFAILDHCPPVGVDQQADGFSRGNEGVKPYAGVRRARGSKSSSPSGIRGADSITPGLPVSNAMVEQGPSFTRGIEGRVRCGGSLFSTADSSNY